MYMVSLTEGGWRGQVPTPRGYPVSLQENHLPAIVGGEAVHNNRERGKLGEARFPKPFDRVNRVIYTHYD
jgi:hypothetical protein